MPFLVSVWFFIAFLVSVLMTFHLMYEYVQIVFSSVEVAEWQPYGKELHTRLTIGSVCIKSNCNFSNFPFWL